MRKYARFCFAASILLLGCNLCAQKAISGLGQDGNADASFQVWGGQDVRLEMNARGAVVEFDCAEGRVLEPIRPTATGDFVARGTYTAAQFGPVRRDNPPRDIPAIYKGTVSGDTMRLQVILENKEIQPPQFTLKKGSDGHVVRCH